MKPVKFLVVAIVFLMIVSCQKERMRTNGNREQKKLDPDLWTEAANGQNPYEDHYFGVYHNHSLNYFRDQRYSYSNDLSWAEDVMHITFDFFCAGQDVRYCVPNLSKNKLSLIVDTALTESLFELCIMRASDNIRGYLDTCLGYFSKYKARNYDDFWKAIVEMESTIYADTTLLEADKQFLLTTTQVARYTGLYWKRAIEDNFFGWPEVFNSVGEAEWEVMARGDVRGCVVGYLNGEITNNALRVAANAGPAASKKKLTQYLQ